MTMKEKVQQELDMTEIRIADQEKLVARYKERIMKWAAAFETRDAMALEIHIREMNGELTALGQMLERKKMLEYFLAE